MSDMKNKLRFSILRAKGDVILPSQKTIDQVYRDYSAAKEKQGEIKAFWERVKNKEAVETDETAKSIAEDERYIEKANKSYEELQKRLDLFLLWKKDQFVHDIQFKKFLSIKDIAKPKAPRAFLNFKENTNDESYLKKMAEYNELVSEQRKINKMLKLFSDVKKNQNHKCYFCNFFDDKFMEIHHKDGDHYNNSPENLVAACTLCHRQHHLFWLSQYSYAELGLANADFLCQEELNHIQRIAIVLNHNADFKDKFGIDGGLGSVINIIKSYMQKPLHSFMISDDVKEKKWISFLKNKGKDFKYKTTDKIPNDFQKLISAINLISSGKTNFQGADKAAIKEFDDLINFTEIKASRGNGENSLDDTIRMEFLPSVSEYIEKIKDSFEADFLKEFNADKEKFNIFELAMALKSIPYSKFEEFNPKRLYLIFNKSIFTEEQIEYYKTLDYFDLKKWGFGDK